jgi:hypothetical protein
VEWHSRGLALFTCGACVINLPLSNDNFKGSLSLYLFLTLSLYVRCAQYGQIYAFNHSFMHKGWVHLLFYLLLSVVLCPLPFKLMTFSFIFSRTWDCRVSFPIKGQCHEIFWFFSWICKFATVVNDTGSKFATSVNDRWQIMGTISGCWRLKVNLKDKMYL